MLSTRAKFVETGSYTTVFKRAYAFRPLGLWKRQQPPSWTMDWDQKGRQLRIQSFSYFLFINYMFVFSFSFFILSCLTTFSFFAVVHQCLQQVHCCTSVCRTAHCWPCQIGALPSACTAIMTCTSAQLASSFYWLYLFVRLAVQLWYFFSYLRLARPLVFTHVRSLSESLLPLATCLSLLE